MCSPDNLKNIFFDIYFKQLKLSIYELKMFFKIIPFYLINNLLN